MPLVLVVCWFSFEKDSVVAFELSFFSGVVCKDCATLSVDRLDVSLRSLIDGMLTGCCIMLVKFVWVELIVLNCWLVSSHSGWFGVNKIIGDIQEKEGSHKENKYIKGQIKKNRLK